MVNLCGDGYGDALIYFDLSVGSDQALAYRDRECEIIGKVNWLNRDSFKIV